MPTWSAAGDIRRNGVIQMIRKFLPSLETFSENDGIALIDGEEQLLPEVSEILSLIKDYDIPLFTGHVSILESAVLAREANRIGFKKLVLNHPDSRTVGATFDQIVEVASLGAYVEICALGLMPLYQRITPKDERNRNDAKHQHESIAQPKIVGYSFFPVVAGGYRKGQNLYF